MKGKIIVNGYYFGESEQYRCRRLLEEFQKKGIDVEIERNRQVHKAGEEFDFDFALFFDKDFCYCKMLEDAGVVVINSSDVLAYTDDKCKTAVFLARHSSVELPETIVAPKQFFYAEDKEYLDDVSKRLGFPLVVKEGYGSLGQQVYLAKNSEELYKITEKIGVKEHLFQKYRPESYGKSVRVIVIGNQAVGAIKLQSEGDFRSNAHLGGKATIFECTGEYKQKAEEVARALGADYCGVDFFADKPVLIEVNGSAYFSEFERITGKNVAKILVEYIINDKVSHLCKE